MMMFGKYKPSQVAKALAATLTAFVTFLGVTTAALTEFLPAEWIAALAGVAVVLTGAAAYLTKMAPTIEQIEGNLDDVIDMIKVLRPGAVVDTTDGTR